MKLKSPKTKFLKVFFLARGRKSFITCHICTRFDAYLHPRMLCRIKMFNIILFSCIGFLGGRCQRCPGSCPSSKPWKCVCNGLGNYPDYC